MVRDLLVGLADAKKGGCDMSFEELQPKALHNWYQTAEEALERRLVAGLI